MVGVSGTGLIQTISEPVLRGNPKGAPAYDAAVQRWLPVGRPAISPDGLRYAYDERYAPESGPRRAKIHVVDARTGADRIVYEGSALAVVEFDEAAIYLIGVPVDEGAAGLYRLDPDTGSLTQLQPDRLFYSVQGGGGWWGDFAMGVGATRLERLDLGSGATETWLSRPGGSVSPIGFVQGEPVVAATAAPGSPIEVLFLEGAGRARRMALTGSPIGGGMFATETYWVADKHGVWLGGSQLMLLSDKGLYSFNQTYLTPAGACL